MDKQDERNWREVQIEGLESVPSSAYMTNIVSSARYTWLSLVPKSLFEQFQRIANIWFLIVSIFQLAALQLDPTTSWSTILPLCVLLSITLIKDAISTYNQLKKDKEINDAEYVHWNGSMFNRIKCKDILVGHMLKISQGESVPADMVLLFTSSGESNVFVDTSSTTGESSLKVKKIEASLRHTLHDNYTEIEVLMNKLVGSMKFEQPNRDYLVFNGKMNIEKFPKTINLDCDNLICRGNVLHGCDWIIGLAVYTGMETKIYLNTEPPKKKISEMEKKVNVWVLYILIVLLLIVLYSIFAAMYLSTMNELSFFQNFVLFTVMYNNIIPISLFVTMDIVRELQGFFIFRDSNKQIIFNTRDVNESLGQIEYILADKTGTITETKLKLEACMIDYCTYDIDPSPEILNFKTEESHFIETDPPLHPSKNSSQVSLRSAILRSSENNVILNFVRCMVACHTVTLTNGKYLGTSPDEVVLVQTAGDLGIKLLSRTQETCRILWLDREVNYEILAQQAFSHENKVSRTLIKDDKGAGFYYIKGGFDALEDVLKMTFDDRIFYTEIVNNFKKKGLRTMVLAYKTVNPDELEEFELKLESARSFPVNSEAKIAELFPLIEFEMEVAGITGIEEIVTRETEECIQQLQAAGLKIWLLSGDSESNTLSTAQKSGIFQEDANIFRINKIRTEIQCIKMMKRAVDHLIFLEENESISHVIRYLTRKSTIVRKEDNFHDYHNSSSEQNSCLNASEEALSSHPAFAKLSGCEGDTERFLARKFIPENLNYSLSIDKTSLRNALAHPDSRELLVCLLVCADSVAFHGLLPHDKATIARLLKNNLVHSPLILAIGDGNADIPMMQAADIAVSVKNLETQTKSYSEVTISKFSQLSTLLLDYGQWNYYRMSHTILLFLYKNFMITVVIFIYSGLCDYSANPIFADSLLMGFNLFNTTIPLIDLGVFDYSPSHADLKIESYSEGYHNSRFNYKKFMEYSLLAIVQGSLLTFFLLGFLKLNLVSSTGRTEDYDGIGTSLYICIVLLVLLEIWLKTQRKTHISALAQIISVGILVVHIATLSATEAFQMYEMGAEILGSELFIMMICTVPLLVVGSAWVLFKAFKCLIPRSQQLTRLESYSGNLHKIYKGTVGLKTMIERDVYDFHKYSLSFCSEYIEKIYKQIYIQENLNLLKLTIIVLWFLLVCWTVLEILLLQTTMIYIITRVLLCAGFTVIMAISATSHFVRYFVFYTLLVITLGLFVKFATEIVFLRLGALSTGVIPSITYILFNVNWLKITYLNILSQLLLLISMSYSFSMNSQLDAPGIQLLLSFMVLDVAIAMTSARVGHNLDKNNRLEYKLIKLKELGVEKTQRILSFLLPSFVKKRVKDGSRYIADDQGTVTIIFCDIVDFESICAEYTPQEITMFLDNIFQKFDSLCSSNGVTKIETVGKTYMACAGLKDSEAEIEPEIIAVAHAQRALVLALSMLQEVQKQKLKNRKALQVKIGINSGPVTAGVVGYHKPQFSLVGDTVNTASRMCSTLELGNKIQLSKASYELLTDRKGLCFTSSIIEAKGKGKMHTYVVNEGQRSTTDEAWLDISQLSSINQPISSIHTYDKCESIRKPRRSLLMTSLGGEEMGELEQEERVEKFKLCNLKCEENSKLKEFRQNTLVSNKDMMAFGLLVACVAYSALLVLAVVQRVFYSMDLALMITQCITVVLLWFSLGMYQRIYLTGYYKLFLLCSMLLMYLQAIFMILYTNIVSDLAALQIMYIILILAHTSGITPDKIIMVSVGIIVSWVIVGVLASENTSYIANAVLVAGFAVINIAAVFKREIQLRSYFNLKKLAEKEIEKTENLLTQMMPPHVLANMKKGKSVTDRFTNVTLLYADIVGFTYWSSDKTPEQVVGMLSDMFTRFDKICVGHNVYKVHTIGDCYVVMGLMNVRKRDTVQECLNVINMGLSMIKVIEEVNTQRNSQLNMRIGVHTGEVVGGVIGTNIVRYDIYGPDVLIANKMESGGEAGKINISEATKNILERKNENNFNFTFNKIIEAKAVGRIFKSYFVSPKST